MKTDHFGLSVSTDERAVVDALDHFAQQLLLNGTEAGKVFAAVKVYPDVLLLNCYCGILFLYLHDDADSLKALPYFQAAEKLSGNEREKLHYQAARAWYNKDHFTAITLYEKITKTWPHDCVAAKFAEWLFYCTGQYQNKRFLELTTFMAAHNQQEPGFLATHSFALELNSHYVQALEVAEQALALEAITPWAHHTIAHVLLLQSNPKRGIQLLENFKSSWKNILPPLAGHNTWHLALFYLSLLDEQKVLAQFSHIWGNMPELSLEQIDAVSLLWRCEMAGMSQEDLLQQVSAKLGQHVYQHYIGFDTAHYVYALVRTNQSQAAQHVIKDALHYAHNLQAPYKDLWLTVCVPLFKGIYAFAEENYKEANAYLQPIVDKIPQIGGSDAQVDLFFQTVVSSLMRAKETQKAQALFNQYLPYYAATPLGQHLCHSI